MVLFKLVFVYSYKTNVKINQKRFNYCVFLSTVLSFKFVYPWPTKISIKFFCLSCLHVEVHLKSGNNNHQSFENVNKQLKTSSFVLTPASLCGLRFTVWKMSNGKMSLKRFETKTKTEANARTKFVQWMH